jgi:queuine tRNA-ribosyltransferase
MSSINLKIEKRIPGKLGRAGVLSTPHGDIRTPAFVTVGTKATVKTLTPEQVKDLGAQVVLANTYHLYLQPGEEILKKSGKIHKFMGWNGPTMTDSGGFQAFSLGAAFGEHVSKIAKGEDRRLLAATGAKEGEEVFTTKDSEELSPLAKITEDGVTFKSHIDGSTHHFTPERSMEIQHNIGADMIFAFDECTSPLASYEYQKEALGRTHRWAKRSLDRHNELLKENGEQRALLGIVQGGRFEDLRKESAKTIGEMDFDGFGIGGSFDKEDMYTVVGWVNEILPENKPRHLLGIGEPIDFFGGIENGVDLFDCVAPTRMGRNGTLHTKDGRINMMNAKYMQDFTPIESDCECYACKKYTRAYLAHLFRAKETLAGTLATIHNLYFTIKLVDDIRQSILDDNFDEFKKEFLGRYYKVSV